MRIQFSRGFVFLFAISLPFTGEAATPMPKALAQQELAINVRGETKGKFYAYAGDNPKLTTKRVLGSGAKADDVRQGYLNNCFLVGTLSSIAHAQPERIAKLFLTKKDGSLALDEDGRASLGFYRRTNKGLVKEAVKVTAGLVYGKDGKPVFTKIANGKLWAPLIEKGYATLLSNHSRMKGFTRLDQGGAPSDVIEAVTGQQSKFLVVNPTKAGADAAWKALKTATANRAIVVAGSLESTDFRSRRNEAIADGLLDKSARQLTLKGQHIVGDHNEAVLGISEKNGERTVTLRNPWGMFVPRGAGRSGGVYTLPLEKFVLFFDGLTYSGKS